MTCSRSTRTWTCRPTSWNASANVSSVTASDGLLVLGVDPGLADTGYGAVRRQNGRLTMVTCGTLKTPANLSEPKRLAILARQLRALIAELHPQAAALVKLSVTGYGAATKGQMLKMVQSLLATRELPRSDDAIDALAIAICHHHSGRLRTIISRAPTSVHA
ncbi:MAG: crossover junction endodeoxyribonuclease RuvC [Chloroflexota bacterium]|nr:MAG: crossover junction endodeoxyribonuclease RuvC [Chloroflexota bacterium]